VKTYLIN